MKTWQRLAYSFIRKNKREPTKEELYSLWDEGEKIDNKKLWEKRIGNLIEGIKKIK